ncbi:hypothetical protein KW790_00965 [Candidatus Parcubacteria bacterium]|nr:hypothetical protein [Candidatus Parcubacteria bacterium]
MPRYRGLSISSKLTILVVIGVVLVTAFSRRVRHEIEATAVPQMKDLLAQMVPLEQDYAQQYGAFTKNLRFLGKLDSISRAQGITLVVDSLNFDGWRGYATSTNINLRCRVEVGSYAVNGTPTIPVCF